MGQDGSRWRIASSGQAPSCSEPSYLTPFSRSEFEFRCRGSWSAVAVGRITHGVAQRGLRSVSWARHDQEVRTRKRSIPDLAKVVSRAVVSHPANQGHRATALVRTVWWQVRKRVNRRPLEVQAFGMRLSLPRRFGSTSNLVYFGERFEWDTTGFVRRYLRDGDLVVDAGANLGLFTFACLAASAPTGRVIAFEPLEEQFGVMRSNLDRNGLLHRVELHESAVGEEAGEQTSRTISTSRATSSTRRGPRSVATALSSALRPSTTYSPASRWRSSSWMSRELRCSPFEECERCSGPVSCRRCLSRPTITACGRWAHLARK